MSIFLIFFILFYIILLVLLSVYSLHAYLMVYLYRKGKNKKVILKKLENTPLVTVQLPIYNERYVVERLINSVCVLDYPKDSLEIQILDDSTDETQIIAKELVEKYEKEGFDIRYIHRPERRGYKAGALKEGLSQAKGEFLAIFDADFTPDRDFLQRTLPYFSDSKVGMVQTRWGHLNDEYSLLTRGQAIGLDGHFVIEQTARNRSGCFMNFNGTAGVWRKNCILDAGNWQDDTLTEDLDLSYRAQLKGWQFIYLNDVVCRGEIPAEVNAFKVQQHRWAMGAIQTAKKILPLIWRRKDLNFLTKFQATVHLTNHSIFPILLFISLSTLPLLMIKVTYQELQPYFLGISLFTLGAFSYPLFYIYSQREVYPNWRKRVLYLPILMGGGIGVSVNNSKAVLRGLLNLKSTFNRTPKYKIETKRDNWRSMKYRISFNFVTIVELFLSLYIFFAFLYACRHREFAAVPFILVYWIGFTYIGGLSLIQSVRR